VFTILKVGFSQIVDLELPGVKAVDRKYESHRLGGSNNLGAFLMVSFSTWRAFYRIPLIRNNREAVRILRDLFYVLVTLHRANRIQEFFQLREVYFKMLNSFAQYGRVDAKDTVDQILQIPWFSDNQRDLYRLIASYNNVIRKMPGKEAKPYSSVIQKQVNEEMDNFFQIYKSLMRFDERDNNRIHKLLQNRKDLDEVVLHFHRIFTY